VCAPQQLLSAQNLNVSFLFFPFLTSQFLYRFLPLQEFVDKFRYNAKRASLVQSRIKAIEREVVVDAVEDEASFTFAFQDRYILISHISHLSISLVSIISPSLLRLLLSSSLLSHSLFLPFYILHI
jgi:ABC transporter